ncbi:increased DNA methylation 2-like [Impatiens glandulifera]|uniref:increased DNA methylation 2-like n=1 Tax=Impatiens glandulifera TaxID=253017 RepID=UPI001FB1245E|nr:increased DNA methylation 2-like [Impatiens glandulifera]
MKHNKEMKAEELQGREGGCDPQLTLVDNAKHARHGLAVGMFNSGECDDAYILQVALPGIRHDISKLSVIVQKTGKVVVEGCMMESKIFKGASIPLGVIVQELPPVGPFSLTYFLPSVVDPRLFQPSFGDDGILNIVIMKDMNKIKKLSNNN